MRDAGLTVMAVDPPEDETGAAAKGGLSPRGEGESERPGERR